MRSPQRDTLILLCLSVAGAAALWFWSPPGGSSPAPADRREVVFWHFWGGEHRAVVQSIVDDFNASQTQHFVRAIAMPGVNLDLKFFLSLTGGAPPDLLNQDDPVLADWAHRGAIMPLDELAGREQVSELEGWLFPPARLLGSYRGKLYGLCNGLDIRALYCDLRALDAAGCAPPATIAELDAVAEVLTPPARNGRRTRYGYLPDPRRLWAWGIVFGGKFYDPVFDRVTANDDPIVRALEWMTSYSRRYGFREVAAFRKGDQALTGSSFPLLEGRYAMIMDGQWRVPELAAAEAAAIERGETPPKVAVVPLPPPAGGRKHAGWVNGNVFVVPRGCRNPEGAWAFMRYWSGFGGHEAVAARHAAAGGWIPPSPKVAEQPAFQKFIERHPNFGTFVDLAASPHQVPTPAIPGAMYFYTEVVRAAEDAMYRGRSPREVLERANQRIQARVEEASR